MEAENRFEKVRAAVARLNPCTHACTFYGERDEEAEITAVYVRAGLERGELCICIVDDGRERILDALSAEGVDTGPPLRDGRLLFFEKRLARELTTLDMLGKIEQWTDSARRGGHAGCRISGEMTWVFDDGEDGLRQLAELEAKLGARQVYERSACLGLCQYDVRQFAPETIREMILLHPFVVVGSRVCRNPYYVPPDRYLLPNWPQHETDWMITNLEHLQEAQDSLQESHERYRSLARRMVQVQERERRDITRELHDRVGQGLTAMRINMDMIRDRLKVHGDEVIRARNEDSLALIDSAFKSVENVMYELRPPMIDEFGLIAALRWYSKAFAERTGIPVDVRGSEASRLDHGVELAFFRIAQEALNNVARHSRARNVIIELRRSDGRLVLSIEDDGVGFGGKGRLPSDRAGYGIITMRERAEGVGGEFEASSRPGGGTRLAVAVALRP